jgi:protein Mpv17
MRHFFLLLSFCCSITAFSAAFSPKRFLGNTITSSSTATSASLVASKYPTKQRRAAAAFNSRHFLVVPRGGQIENDLDSDEIIDLDSERNQGVDIEQEDLLDFQDDQGSNSNDKNQNEEPTLAAAGVASSPSLPLMNILSSLGLLVQSAGSSYSSALTAYPILTKSITAGVTFFLSDYAAQRIERPKKTIETAPESKSSRTKANKKSQVGKSSTKVKASKTASVTPPTQWRHDWVRTLTSTLVGLFYFGPAAHYWYEWIFSVLPGTSLASTLQKAILGQVLFGPSFTCIFFAASLMQAGQFNISNWVQKIKRDLPGAWISGSAFWPLVDLISYSVVPVKFIPLFINLCSFIWTVYLSMVANRLTSSDAKV